MKSRKTLLIINNNMKVGGVQKALVNILWALHDRFDITLLLFCQTGALMQDIPSDVKVVKTRSLYRYVGMSQGDCKTTIEKMVRAFFVVLTKVLGFPFIVPILNFTVAKDVHEEYSAIISFLHGGAQNVFYGGTAEYALKMKNKGEKINYIHCDYERSGTATRHNCEQYRRFQKLICVSDGVRKQFLRFIPEVAERTFVLQNPIDAEAVIKEASKNTYEYNDSYINLLTVARLSHEKGIDRFIRAMGCVDSSRLRYYVVGEGKYREDIEKAIRESNLIDRVFLLGEDINPYRYMKNADMLVVPSYHEAAPVVYQEALVLNLPVFSTRTLSTEEMIGDDFGFIVENSNRGIEDMLREIVEKPEYIKAKKGVLMERNKQEKRTFDVELERLIN